MATVAQTNELDELFTPGVAAEIVPSPREARVQRIEAMKEAVLRKSVAVVEAAQRFGEIDPEATEPPPEWVAEVGEKAAMERFRLAKYALMSAKDGPVGLKIATSVMAGLLKIEAAKSGAPTVMNAVLIQMPSSSAPMEEIIVENIE